MIHGSCLCGDVRFELTHATGPFEICHCTRCRKVTGSAFMAGLGVLRKNFSWISGIENIKHYDAPLLHEPPRYRVCFCATCGSPVPDPSATSDWLELPAGLLDNNPEMVPDKHIFIEHKAPWHTICDSLPQLDEAAIRRDRMQGEQTNQ